MEADWEVEIGPEAPIIDAAWDGYVDLRSRPERVAQIPEAAGIPGMPGALLCLNGEGSPVWTAKCDVWRLESIDPDEMGCSAEQSSFAMAAYIDLLPRAHGWSELGEVEEFSRSVAARLKEEALSCCRVDLVVRRAFLGPKECGLGVSAYAAGCGATAPKAISALGAAVSSLAAAVLGRSASEPITKYNGSNTGE